MTTASALFVTYPDDATVRFHSFTYQFLITFGRRQTSTWHLTNSVPQFHVHSEGRCVQVLWNVGVFFYHYSVSYNKNTAFLKTLLLHSSYFAFLPLATIVC